ncbi:hypothetical protein WMF31_03990 [Sorangium sp. So ce1036]|uniref:hypothetical protein n=1 Tax=Sorangium sp. So ce1036 TaxID=3133328 RepID=UPI003EFD07F7
MNGGRSRDISRASIGAARFLAPGRQTMVKPQTRTGHMDKIDLLWRGPHPWPLLGAHTTIEDFKHQGGLYIFTVEHAAGFLIYCAG